MTDPAQGWTPVRLRVLAALLESESLVWPLDLARRLGIPYGTVYDTLRRIYDLGWTVGVTGVPAPSRPPRVMYRLTALGRKEAPSLLPPPENEKEI